MGTPATHILGKVSARVSNHTANVGSLILQTSSNGSTLADTMVLTSAGGLEPYNLYFHLLNHYQIV